MKIIGLFLTWNNLEFFKRSLKQALSFCDEILLVDGCHSRSYPTHSTDGTYEYIQSLSHPRLRVFDLGERLNRYDKTQRFLREELPKKSQYWRPGNWIFNLDDDLFFFERDLLNIKATLSSIEHPTFAFKVRYFFYNFRFNLLQKGGNFGYKILDDFELRGIGYPCYKGGGRFNNFYLEDVIGFHYSYVKKPERMKARWQMSVEKGTKSSALRFEKWMSIKWNMDVDILQYRKEISEIRPAGKPEYRLSLPEKELNIYTGEHPSALDDHPWRYINDIRKVK